MELDETQRSLIAAIDSARSEILSVSHSIHGRPELGKEEVFASTLVADTLESAGFTVEHGYAGLPTALRAAKGTAGYRVAFLAEYDALPVIGHGCGHNLITAAALGAGIGLGAVVKSCGGQVLVIGTPAEETDGAKVAMVAHGCFDNIDAAFMVHPYDGNYAEVESLAMDALELKFYGRSAHAAASPWDGRNALDAVLLTFNAINALRQHIKPDARIHGIITHGGEAPNVVPEFAAARFYVRARHRVYLDELVTRFKACAESAALATGTRVEISTYEASFDDMASNTALSGRFCEYMVSALGSGPFARVPDSFGSLDMGNVSQVIPAVHALVDITAGVKMSLHTAQFRDAASTAYADEAIIRAAKALALSALDVLRDAAFLEAARVEFRTRLGHETKGSDQPSSMS